MGGVGEALGRFLDTLGHLLAAFWLFKNNFFSSMGPILAPRNLLNAFGVDLGRVWEGLGKDLGRDLEGLKLQNQFKKPVFQEVLKNQFLLIDFRALWGFFGILLGLLRHAPKLF